MNTVTQYALGVAVVLACYAVIKWIIRSDERKVAKMSPQEREEYEETRDQMRIW